MAVPPAIADHRTTRSGISDRSWRPYHRVALQESCPTRSSARRHTSSRRVRLRLQIGMSSALDRFAQLLLGSPVQGCLDHLAAVRLDALDQLVSSIRASEHYQGGGAGTEPRAEVFHEQVVDTLLAQLAAEAAGGRADRGPQQRGEEQEADRRAAGGTDGGTVLRHAPELVQLYLAVGRALDYHGVLEPREALLRRADQHLAHPLRRVHVRICDRHQLEHDPSHLSSPGAAPRPSRRARGPRAAAPPPRW